jgi:hypothetical protein
MRQQVLRNDKLRYLLSVGAYKTQNRFGVRAQYLYRHCRPGLAAFQQLQCLRVQSTGLQHEGWNVQTQARNQMADDDVFSPQAGGLFDRLVARSSIAQCLLASR